MRRGESEPRDNRRRWKAGLVALIAWVALLPLPSFAADTIEEWDAGLTDWEYYFTYDGQTHEKFSEFVIGAGTGIGQTFSIGLVGGLDHNDTECGVLKALGIFAFYRIPSISEKYGIDLDIMADFAWQEVETQFELYPPFGGIDGVPIALPDTEDVYVWDVGVEVSYTTRYVTPYMRAFVIDNDVDDLVTGDFTLATLFTVIPERMEFLVEWGIEKTEGADAQHSIGLGLNTFLWFWKTGGNDHAVELIPDVRYFFENDETEESFWVSTVGLILTW